ncbi:hypothetical protein G6F43_010599 [Rhizopus delemar]|nr:hypothetical protein G6F43_010599 [Rhizopus delemar]
MIQLFEKHGRYVTLVKDKVKSYESLTLQIPSWEQGHYLDIVWSNMKSICNPCHVDDHTRVSCPVLLRRRKPTSSRKQVATYRSRLMNTNVELTNTEKEALLLNSLQEIDTEMSAEDNSSVDEENIDRSNLSTQNNEDSSHKIPDRKEATKRLQHPLVTFNSLSMNIRKRNSSETFTPTSAMERAKKKSALFDDSLEVEEDVAFEDEYDRNNFVPGGSSQPSNNPTYNHYESS